MVDLMKAIVLTGGFGTRLRPMTFSRPKPMVPVLGKPNLGYILDGLEETESIDEVLISLHYMKTEIKDYIDRKYSDYDKEISYVEDEYPLETGGSVKNAAKKIDSNDPFLVVYGDVFTNTDYQNIIEDHGEEDLTLAVTKVYDPERYGVVELNDDRIVDFKEKPEKPERNLVSAGIFVMEHSKLDLIEKGEEVSMEKEIFPEIEMKAHKIPQSSYWMDLGTPTDYKSAHKIALDNMYEKDSHIHSDSEIPDDAVVRGPVHIGENVEFGKNVEIGRYTFIGDNVKLRNRARVNNSIILKKSSIGPEAQVKDSILCDGVQLKRSSIVKENAILGDYAKVFENRVVYGGRIGPWKKVEEDLGYIRIKLAPDKVRPDRTPSKCPLGLDECVYEKYKGIASEKPPCDECMENQWLF